MNRLLNLLSGTNPLITGADAANRFIVDFERRYEYAPPFSATGYKDAVLLAKQRGQFLLVYLHSPMHEDTDQFCSSSLRLQSVRDELSSNFVTWGGSLEYAEPYALSNDHLKPSCFPFMAVLLCKPDGVEYCLDRIEGFADGQNLLARLKAVKVAHDRALDSVRLEQFQR